MWLNPLYKPQKMWLNGFGGDLMTDKEYITPEYITSDDIKQLREKLGMTQNQFAQFVHASKRTVENWESQKKEIKGPIVTLVDILAHNLELEKSMRVKENELKVRLWYMYRNMVCTVIDVDEMERKVKIQNFVKNPLFRAFGVNTEPEYSDYEDFLESRCFPKTRDKMKIELKRLDLPFYDPVMIIEKTEGRMAEDDFWIRIER